MNGKGVGRSRPRTWVEREVLGACLCQTKGRRKWGGRREVCAFGVCGEGSAFLIDFSLKQASRSFADRARPARAGPGEGGGPDSHCSAMVPCPLCQQSLAAPLLLQGRWAFELIWGQRTTSDLRCPLVKLK